MAKQIVNIANYTFDASAQTITFDATYTGLELAHIELITNLIDNVIIYQFNKPTKGGALVGLVLTLDYDTTAMSDTDELQIFIEADFLSTSVDTGLVQYTTGDTEATPIGTVLMGKNVGDEILPIVISPTGRVEVTAEGSIDVTSFNGNVGQQLMVDSLPVVIASDQSAIPISVASLPLPTGAATEDKQDDEIALLDSVIYTEGGTTVTPNGVLMMGVDNNVPRLAKPALMDTDGRLEINASIVNLSTVGQQIMSSSLPVVIASNQSAIPVTDNGGSITVDGTVAISGTVPISAAALPLPSGAATSAKQDTEIAALNLLNEARYTGGDTIVGTGKGLIIGGWDTDGDTLETLKIEDQSLRVKVTASAIPTGASTSALQTTGNTSLATLAGAVAGTEMQVDVLTLPAITGTVTANAGTNLNTSALALETTATAIKTAVELIDNAIAGSEMQVDVITMPTVAVTGTFWQATQPISGTVDTELPAAAALSDATANPTTTSVGSLSLGYNGSTWDRLRTQDAGAGNQRVIQYDGELGVRAGMTSLGDLTTAQRYTKWYDSLADGVSFEWTQTNANGGTTTSSGGEGLIQTSANAAGSAQIIGPVVNYYAGQTAWLNSAIRLGDTGSAGNIRRWGIYTVSGTTPQNGFYFELNGTTLNAVSVTGGSATAVASTSWTKFSTAPFTLDTNYHGYEIRFTANSVFFYIDGVLRHNVAGTTTPLTATLNLPIAAVSVNTSGATNRVLAIRNIGVGGFGTSLSNRDGALITAPQQKATYRASHTAVLVAAVTVDRPFVTIYGSATKTVRVQSITISGLTLTAVAYLNIGLRKYSTAVSGGTSTALTKVPLDSASAASTATNVNAYTAIPTAGTPVGDISSRRVMGQATTAAAAGIPQVVDFDLTPVGDGSAVVLRGIAEGIGLVWLTAPATAVSMLVRIEYTEE